MWRNDLDRGEIFNERALFRRKENKRKTVNPTIEESAEATFARKEIRGKISRAGSRGS